MTGPADDGNARVLLSPEDARAILLRSLPPDVTDARILEAMGKVPRERFIDPELAPFAYADRPLPIGFGQTISQPRIVGMMLQMLRLQPEDRVLDLGSGSGYQTAILAELVREVVAVELIPELVERSRRVLTELGYKNVSVHQAGKELGWPAGAPYDAIVVAAASPRIPMSLVEQLADGGRMIIPVGELQRQQELMLVERTKEGYTVARKGGCGFVPLIGREAFSASEGPRGQTP
jgi:protein-L-isoaspartate(D-aspartate) O-methyltransferase